MVCVPHVESANFNLESLIQLLFYMWGHCFPYQNIHVTLDFFHEQFEVGHPNRHILYVYLSNIRSPKCGHPKLHQKKSQYVYGLNIVNKSTTWNNPILDHIFIRLRHAAPTPPSLPGLPARTCMGALLRWEPMSLKPLSSFDMWRNSVNQPGKNESDVNLNFCNFNWALSQWFMWAQYGAHMCS